MEGERVPARTTEWVMPCLWVAGVDFDRVTDAFSSGPAASTLVECAAFGDDACYQVEWSDEVDRRVDELVDREGVILDARVIDGRWSHRRTLAASGSVRVARIVREFTTISSLDTSDVSKKLARMSSEFS